MTRFTDEQRIVGSAYASYRIRLDAGHERTHVRQFGNPFLVRIDEPFSRDTCTGRISLDVHHSIGNAAKEITVSVFTCKQQLLSPFHIQHNLLCQIGLLDHPLIYCLPVGFHDKPCTGIGTLVITRPYDERNLVITLVQPETGSSILGSGKRLAHRKLQA